MKSLELFAGAGGLALGCEQAGFSARRLVERDKWAVQTLKANFLDRKFSSSECEVIENDVRKVTWDDLIDKIDLVAGGPPCQPFSLGGKHQASDDPRDMFPTTATVISKIRPKAFILENVRGLTRRSFAEYFQYILLMLSFPECQRKKGMSWTDHSVALQRHSVKSRHSDLRYRVETHLVNAADYGVPQHRERVFVIGLRSDLDLEWKFPEATHSRDGLLYSQWVSGDYWSKHRIRLPQDFPSPSEAVVRRLSKLDPDSLRIPWMTTRDALADLPQPEESNALSPTVSNHVLQVGARVYPGHTGSPLDLPSKTLKAGSHGVPGGENMMVLPSGDVRYFTGREAARLQTFPDEYFISGAWGEVMRQLGNAVPVKLAQVVAESVHRAILS